jgi:hypothetical protein
MALAPDNAPWYRRFRMLLGIYLIAMTFGVREFVLSRTRPAVDPETQEWSRMAEVVARINPSDVDTDYLLALEALKAGDEQGFQQHVETALLDKHAKHNDIILRAYAQHLFTTNADYRQVNEWLNRWRTNHPASGEGFEIPLAAGPSGPADDVALQREFDSIDWLLRYQMIPPAGDGSSQWRVMVYFRPAREIDIRQAVAAVSILALPPSQRGQFRVTCLSLENCQRVPR